LLRRVNRVSNTQTCEMKHDVRAAHGVRHVLGVSNIRHGQLDLIARQPFEVFGAAIDEVVDHHDAVTARHQLSYQFRTDESRSASNYNDHLFTLSRALPSATYTFFRKPKKTTRLIALNSCRRVAKIAPILLMSDSYRGSSGATISGCTTRDTKS